MEISLDLARKIILNRQLIFPHEFVPNLLHLESIFNRLGYVQIDTIKVINRAHHHTLWTRDNSYLPARLDKLQKDKKVFEYWGHAASYLPMQDYRFYLPRMRSFLQPEDSWAAATLKDNAHLLEPVLQRIKHEGPLMASDFKSDPGFISSGWGNWKPAKKVLELLFWQGKLMIKERRNFQKVYDLTENVLPDNIDTTFPSRSELASFLVTRAVNAQGIISLNGILDHISTRDKTAVSNALSELLDKKELIRLTVENLDVVYFTSPDIISSVVQELPKKVFILSPFDNLIINRKRLKKIFELDYRLECYYPQSKRKYGYFVLPLLYRDKFIGRMDCTGDRKQKMLLIKSIYSETGQFTETQCSALAAALIKLAAFNSCNKISFLSKADPLLKELIRREYELN